MQNHEYIKALPEDAKLLLDNYFNMTPLARRDLVSFSSSLAYAYSAWTHPQLKLVRSDEA
jgi:hypothetical protein